MFHFVITFILAILDVLCNNNLSHLVVPDAFCNNNLSNFVVKLFVSLYYTKYIKKPIK